MPEYIAPAQLPQGMAEQLIALRAQSGNPWAALAQSLGQNVQHGVENYRQRKANAPLNTDQQAAMGIRSPAPGPVQPGQAPLTQAGGGPAFARGMPRDLASTILQRQTQEDIARETTTRMMGVQNLKGSQGQMDVDEGMAKKLGLEHAGPYPQKFIDSLLAKQGKVESAGLGAASREKVAKDKLEAGPSEQQQERTGQFWQKEFDKVLNESTPAMAGSRKGLGVAYNNNMRADRLLMTKDVSVLPQQLDLMMADLQGIYQGGQPHAAAMDRSAISNVSTKIADLKQKLTGNPHFVNSPEWIKTLKEITREVKKVDNRAIKSHMDDIEKSKSNVIAKHSDQWKAHKETVLRQLEESDPAKAPHEMTDAELMEAYKQSQVR